MGIRSEQLDQNGAAAGQSLIWNGTDWVPGGELGDLDVVLIRRSTTYVLTNTYVGLTFDITSTETNPAVAEHNATNTERIDLKQAGLYQVTYDIDCDLTSTAAPEARLYVNGNTEVLGSYDIGKIGANNSNVSMSTTISYQASANDYIEIQVRDLGASVGTIRINSVLQVVRLAGKTGPAGSSGTDTDAIHDNIASEISAIASKATPISGDFLLIEDSAAGNVKKSITIGDLPGSSDELVKVSSDDTTAGYLENKIVGSGGTTISTLNPGGNEDLQIASPALSDTVPTNVTKAAASAGAATESSRRDHKHNISTAAPGQGVGGGNLEGTATSLARSDHDHTLRETGGPTNLTLASIPDGQYLKRSGSTIIGDTVSGGVGVHAETISSWTLDSGLYRADITHSLGTNDIIVQGYLIADNKNIGFEEIERTDTNTVRIWVDSEENVRIVISSTSSGESGLSNEFIEIAADQLLSPNNADWTVNALAPLSADSNNLALSVRRFDDTIEEGVGFLVTPPTGATNIVFRFKSRAETAPAGARTVGLKLYNRGIPDNGAVESWSAGNALSDIDITTNEYWQYDEETIALSTLGVTANELTQFELTRINPVAGTELSGDWVLVVLAWKFT
jgi:hypothetical protein